MSVKGSITKSDFLPYDEYQRLLKCLEVEGKYKEYMYCILSFCLSLRVGDILKLKWGDILGHDKVIVREQKTSKVKPIPIGSKPLERIKEMYDLMGKPKLSCYILSNHIENEPMSRQYLNRLVKKRKEKYSLKIDNFSTHTFRKTFGRYVYEKNGRTQESLIMLQYIFRHHSITTTMRYIGIRDDEVSAIYNSIDV